MMCPALIDYKTIIFYKAQSLHDALLLKFDPILNFPFSFKFDNVISAQVTGSPAFAFCNCLLRHTHIRMQPRF
jgi:hypothetical protein